MIEILKNLFKSQKPNFKIQSFTFFIPAPPNRSTGYREKQFDKVFFDFINKGYEILSFNTQAYSSPNQSGMWIVCVVRALNEQAEPLSLNELMHDQVKGKSDIKSEIEGLYYIDDISGDEN